MLLFGISPSFVHAQVRLADSSVAFLQPYSSTDTAGMQKDSWFGGVVTLWTQQYPALTKGPDKLGIVRHYTNGSMNNSFVRLLVMKENKLPQSIDVYHDKKGWYLMHYANVGADEKHRQLLYEARKIAEK